MRRLTAILAGAALALGLAGCGGGGSSSAASTSTPPATATTTQTAQYAVPSPESLSVADVETALERGVAEARARGRPATLAVVDRVGNVLAVYTMAGAPATAHIPSAPNGSNTDLQGAEVPATLAAISKAVTGAYLSSAGNAFSTRTAGEIVQAHFPPSPAAANLESGPLFGVQFSSLPCSDLVSRYSALAPVTIGPKRAPLGLSADPGGLPLYKNGVVVGGVGVEADGAYALDPDVSDVDASDDELIAVAAGSALAAPIAIRADRISANGTTLRYIDQDTDALKSNPAAAPAFATLGASTGALVTVRGYFGEGGPAILAGQAYGAEASGCGPRGRRNTPTPTSSC